MYEIGRWYAPDLEAVVRSDEERADDERYLAGLQETGIPVVDPWARRQNARAVAAMLSGMLEQAGRDAYVELASDEETTLTHGRIERVEMQDGILQAFFTGPPPINDLVGEEEDEAAIDGFLMGFEFASSINLEFVGQARLLPIP